MSADHLDDLPAGAVRDEVLRLVRTEGVIAAVRAAIGVLNDPKAQPAAKATMASLVCKLSGHFDKPADSDDPLGLAKMPTDEIRKLAVGCDRELADTQKRLEHIRRRLAQDGTDDVDVFA